MAVRRGIDLLDVLPQTSSLALQVPDAIVEKIGILTVVDLRSTSSVDFFLHEGVLQSAAETLDLDTSSWALRIPGLTHGLPFRLAIRRPGPAVTGAQEAAPALWTLDIEVNDVEALIPGVRAAKPAGGTGVTPLTLTPTGTTDAAKRVYLVASGVVRISGGGTGGTQVQIVDAPDPLDPTAPTGAVVRLTARPSSFLFGDSHYGMTLDEFIFDLSRTFTPAEIVARGHDETWEGVSFKETTFYFPPDTGMRWRRARGQGGGQMREPADNVNAPRWSPTNRAPASSSNHPPSSALTPIRLERLGTWWADGDPSRCPTTWARWAVAQSSRARSLALRA